MKLPLIAIADDDLAFATYLKTFLDGRGYQSRIYSHGEDLLAAAHLGELPDEIALEAALNQAMEKRQLVSEVTELRRRVNDDQAQAFFWEKSETMQSIAVIVDRVEVIVTRLHEWRQFRA
jgi:ActR/RegA family two-component response regulator